jgi:hypothetical protein
MSLSFIETYYKDITKWLVDIDSSKRYPEDQRLRDLHSLDAQIFEELLGVAGPESLMGYSEAILSIEAEKSMYPLPQGFRQLIAVERRREDSATTTISIPRDQVIERLRSKTFYDEGSGITILSGNRGIRIDPLPLSDSEWVMVYLRGTGQMHYAKASDVSDHSLTTGTPPENGGTLVLQPNYYNGMEIRVYDARVGAPQTRTVVQFDVQSETRGIFHLRHSWSPKPEPPIWYEVRPSIPDEYDELYGLDAALRVLTLRNFSDIANQLLKFRDRAWQACRHYFASNTMERGPARLRPLTNEDRMPTGGPPRV